MAAQYLHQHKEFPELLRILEGELEILSGLIEKDYWIMHVLYGVQKQNFDFELKGGTSLSKGYKIINRFSEDIDIYIHPPGTVHVNENTGSSTKGAVDGRKAYYDWLRDNIIIEGIIRKERDPQFDDLPNYRSGGIRLYYETFASEVKTLKEGILLEAGFDDISPNNKITISSWAYEKAVSVLPPNQILDNRAIDIKCYDPGYTLVEKLQTISTKFRKEQEEGTQLPNYIRQYYDVYCLLDDKHVQNFIGTDDYKAHKQRRFPKKDFKIPMIENQAYLLSDRQIRDSLKKRYELTKALYYKGQPDFEDVLEGIKQNLPKL